MVLGAHEFVKDLSCLGLTWRALCWLITTPSPLRPSRQNGIQRFPFLEILRTGEDW